MGICSECYTYHRRCTLAIPRATWRQLDENCERVERELERVEEKKRQLQAQLRRFRDDERRLISQEMASVREMEVLEEDEDDAFHENDPAVASGGQDSSSAPDPVRSTDLNEIDLNEIDLNEIGLNEIDLNETELGAQSTDQPVFDPMDFANVDWSFDPTNWLDLADLGFGDEILQ
jgi:hypothetical protein